MTKLCHHLPNLRAISSTSTNPVVSPYRLRAIATTTNTQTLPINNPTISHRTNHKVPTAPLQQGNNRLSALSFGQPPLHIHPITTEVNLRNLRLLTRAHFNQQNPQQPQHNPNHRRPPILSQRSSTQPQQNNRPPFRPTPNPSQCPPSNRSTNNHSCLSFNAATIVCNNYGRLGHYACNCSNSRRSSQNNPASNSQSSNNENTAPCS